MEQLLMSLREALERMSCKQRNEKERREEKNSIGVDRYLDFSEAFDTVSWNLNWKINSSQLGWRQLCVDWILAKRQMKKFIMNSCVTRWLEMSSGVIVSLGLLCIFINDLEKDT